LKTEQPYRVFQTLGVTNDKNEKLKNVLVYQSGGDRHNNNQHDEGQAKPETCFINFI